jgi:endonuclease YncB( thermonuclease family)
LRSFSPRDRWLLLAAAAIGLVLVIGRLMSVEPPVTGRATAVDGDTLHLGGERVRIVGMDAPELGQRCRDSFGAEWSCGEAARLRLSALLQQGDTACRPQGRDRYGRLLASCAAGEADLGEAMVRGGLAVADGYYFDSEAMARNEKAGIWAGDFVLPAQWRRQHEFNAGRPEPGNPWNTIREWFR